jgi:serine/threonine protein phosphatase PrpC
MGDHLSTPDRNKDFDKGSNKEMSFVACGMQGWRTSMEDSHIAELDLGNGVSYFGVFDGHGGK